jgi:hypothetical protein
MIAFVLVLIAIGAIGFVRFFWPRQTGNRPYVPPTNTQGEDDTLWAHETTESQPAEDARTQSVHGDTPLVVVRHGYRVENWPTKVERGK